MPPAKPNKWASLEVSAIKSWVRIRPLGDKGHVDGERVEKELGDFDENSVNIISHDMHGKVQTYDYPSKVFPTTCTQEDVGKEILPGLLNDFWNERNCMIFAYGQTGTGKTTTMFGFPESLTSETEDAGWGLLPRAVHATLAHNAAQAQQGVHSVLLLSAVEFYAFMAFDLADVAGKQMCTMKGHQVVGNTYTQCDSPAILKEFIERVYGNRKVVATKMNEGSSRSHCAIMLTLLTLDTRTQQCKQRTFTIVDLAGAERPEKALGERISKDKAIQEMFRYLKTPSADMSPGLQGFLINFELSNLLTEVVTATNAHKTKQQYKSSGFGNSASIAFFGGALAGEARLGVIICLSQSKHNGWETWYSIANYGKSLAALRTRVRPVEARPMDKALADAEKAAAEAAASFGAISPDKATPSQMKYVPFKLGMKVYTEQLRHFLTKAESWQGRKHMALHDLPELETGSSTVSSSIPSPSARASPVALGRRPQLTPLHTPRSSAAPTAKSSAPSFTAKSTLTANSSTSSRSRRSSNPFNQLLGRYEWSHLSTSPQPNWSAQPPLPPPPATHSLKHRMPSSASMPRLPSLSSSPMPHGADRGPSTLSRGTSPSASSASLFGAYLPTPRASELPAPGSPTASTTDASLRSVRKSLFAPIAPPPLVDPTGASSSAFLTRLTTPISIAPPEFYVIEPPPWKMLHADAVRIQGSYDDVRRMFEEQQESTPPNLVQMYASAAKYLPETSQHRALVETQRDILQSRQEERARQKRAKMYADMREMWTGGHNAFGSRGSVAVDGQIKDKLVD